MVTEEEEEGEESTREKVESYGSFFLRLLSGNRVTVVVVVAANVTELMTREYWIASRGSQAPYIRPPLFRSSRLQH